MVKDNNVTGRLGSTNDDKPRNQRMCPMQNETGENESSSPESTTENKVMVWDFSVWTIRFFAIIYFSFLMYHMWDDDELRLHLLHGIVKFLQMIARVIGTWALEFERSYNDVVNSLH